MDSREEIVKTCIPISMTRRLDPTLTECLIVLEGPPAWRQDFGWDRPVKSPKSKIYTVYSSMKARCYNPKNNRYASYGARGIKVCEEWLNDYAEFWNWYQDNYHADGLTIDRKDNNGPYSPENCHFVDKTAQARNTRATIRITIFGEEISLRDAVDRFSVVPLATVKCRLKRGWPADAAVCLPRINSKIEPYILAQIGLKKVKSDNLHKERFVTIDGKVTNLRDAYKAFNSRVTYQSVYRRIEDLGWQPLAALAMPHISTKIQKVWIDTGLWNPTKVYEEKDYETLI